MSTQHTADSRQKKRTSEKHTAHSTQQKVRKTVFLTRDCIDIGEWHRIKVEGGTGAAVEFIGIVRQDEQGRRISHLNYEAYSAMAECVIEEIINQAQVLWLLEHVFIRHRIGDVLVGDVAVLIGVQASHRDEAFEACRFLIDTIKEKVPIWKTAVCIDGTRLASDCSHNTSGKK